MSTEERYGFRDESISRFHRTLGDDCPAVDLDFVLVEYTRGLPAALVEYKHERAKKLEYEHASMRALCALADRSAVPFFVVHYADDLTWFRVTGINRIALKLCPHVKTVTGDRYRKFMLDLRARELRKNKEADGRKERPVPTGEPQCATNVQTERDEDLPHF